MSGLFDFDAALLWPLEEERWPWTERGGPAALERARVLDAGAPEAAAEAFRALRQRLCYGPVAPELGADLVSFPYLCRAYDRLAFGDAEAELRALHGLWFGFLSLEGRAIPGPLASTWRRFAAAFRRCWLKASLELEPQRERDELLLRGLAALLGQDHLLLFDEDRLEVEFDAPRLRRWGCCEAALRECEAARQVTQGR